MNTSEAILRISFLHQSIQ